MSHPVVISSGVHTGGLYVSHSEILEIDSGGSVSDTTIRGDEVISVGGAANGDVVDDGIIAGMAGLQDVYGMASGSILHSGGHQQVESGGMALGTHVQSGGIDGVLLGGSETNVTISGGRLEISGGAIVDGAVCLSGSIVDGGNGTGGGTLDNAVLKMSDLTVASGG